MEFLERLTEAVPSAALTVAVLIALVVTRRALDRRPSRGEHQFRDQLLMLGLTLAGVLVIIVSLPLSDATRSQLLSLLGVLLSAMIALASTTFVGNAMAGMMLRSLRHFRPGDFVRVGDHFGRVSDRGLFHVEIQTEDRDLTTLPNLYLVTNPVTVVHAEGTVVSATVSLGYDVSREVIQDLLVGAAERAGLADPFVHVTELGDFSVTYRIAGICKDVKRLLSVRSRLREMMLDELHAGGVEIVSPTFMNQRVLAKEDQFIPPVAKSSPKKLVEPKPVESLVFDKADEAETVARIEEHIAAVEETIEATKKEIEATENPGTERELTDKLGRLERSREKLIAVLDDMRRKD